MSRVSFIILGIGIFIVVLFNFTLSTPSFPSIEEEGDFWASKGEYSKAEEIYKNLVKQKPLNPNLQFKYIRNHFSLSKINEDLIFDDYKGLTHDNNPNLQDIGNYGLGLCYSFKNDLNKALFYFSKVRNKNLKYLNNSIGWCLEKQEMNIEAEKAFLKEISLNGNSTSAYRNLFHLYKKTENNERLESLLKNYNARKVIPFDKKRDFFFHHGNFLYYFISIFESIVSTANIYGFIAALSILTVWILYLRRLDIYETEKWSSTIITLLMGVFFAQVTFFLHDVNEFLLNNKLSGNFINDFIYCILGIGAIEELVKIIPLLIILAFTDEINEPIDFIKYASVSAAGFAFTENLLYFQNDAMHVIPSRALICVTGHMVYSSVIAYGIMLSRYKGIPFWKAFLVSFSVASILHGFYDFWLINQSVHAFSKLSLIFFLLSTLGWIVLVNNCLNNSPFFDKEKAINVQSFRDYLFASLIGIFFIMFILISIQSGVEEGNKALLKETTVGLIILPLLVKNMSNIKVLKNYWSFHSFPNHSILYEGIIHKKILLQSSNNDKHRSIIKVTKGKIHQREVISNNPNWFEVELENNINFKNHDHNKIYISPNVEIGKDRNKFFGYVIFRSSNEVRDQMNEKQKWIFAGKIIIKIIQ